MFCIALSYGILMIYNRTMLVEFKNKSKHNLLRQTKVHLIGNSCLAFPEAKLPRFFKGNAMSPDFV